MLWWIQLLMSNLFSHKAKPVPIKFLHSVSHAHKLECWTQKLDVIGQKLYPSHMQRTSQGLHGLSYSSEVLHTICDAYMVET